jgi:hypothetical protein
MNGRWLIALLPILVGLLVVPATAEDITVTAEVPYYISVVFNYNTVNFGTVAPGSTDYIAPGTYDGVYNVSVTTNVDLSVYVHRSEWTPHEGYLTLKFDAQRIPSLLYPTYIIGTTSELLFTIEVGSYTHYHGYFLTVRSDTPAGSYSTTVTITYAPPA